MYTCMQSGHVVFIYVDHYYRVAIPLKYTLTTCLVDISCWIMLSSHNSSDMHVVDIRSMGSIYTYGVVYCMHMGSPHGYTNRGCPICVQEICK